MSRSSILRIIVSLAATVLLAVGFVIVTRAALETNGSPFPTIPKRSESETRSIVRDKAVRMMTFALGDGWKLDCYSVGREHGGPHRWKAMGSAEMGSAEKGQSRHHWEVVCEERSYGVEVIEATIDDKEITTRSSSRP
jgi:hypothetical protein